MDVKNFVIDDLSRAAETAERELGVGAIVVSHRKIRKGLFQKPAYEITAVREAPSAAAPDARLDSIEQMMSGVFGLLQGSFTGAADAYPDELKPLVTRMLAQEVREELAHSIAREAVALLARERDLTAGDAVRRLLLTLLGAPQPIAVLGAKRRVVLVAGPTGVGKTTSVVKLAAHFAIKQQKKVGVINADAYRVGAPAQLGVYADILDVPVVTVYNPEDAGAALTSMSDRDLVFIDTAGKRPGDETHRAELEALLRVTEPEDILLCVPAGTGFAAMRELVDAYDFLPDYRLLVTKLDETASRGALVNLAWYARHSLAYVTTGQAVPDDLYLPDPEELASALLR